MRPPFAGLVFNSSAHHPSKLVVGVQLPYPAPFHPHVCEQQNRLTVNQLPSGYVGANPTVRTIFEVTQTVGVRAKIITWRERSFHDIFTPL